jgi:hypothetical protein
MVKFSRGDNDLGKIIYSLNEFFDERLGHPRLAVKDASHGQQTVLGTIIDYQSAGEDVLTEDDELLMDLGSILTSIQGRSLASIRR